MFLQYVGICFFIFFIFLYYKNISSLALKKNPRIILNRIYAYFFIKIIMIALVAITLPGLLGVKNTLIFIAGLVTINIVFLLLLFRNHGI